MRILLDSRYLIDVVEHNRPTPPQDFDQYLCAGNHEIVLSFTNVRELVSPLAFGDNFMRLRPLLQLLEHMPHVYIKEVTIVRAEIQAAVDAFTRGIEYEGCSVYVTRWDRTLSTLPGQRRSAADGLVNLRLDDIVYYISRVTPHVFGPPDQHLPRLRAQLEQDRASLRTGQAPARRHFIGAIKRHAATHGVALPDGREDEFAEWVYANPVRCPGLRLNHETFRALMANYEDIPETGDFSDLAHIFAVPYVEAATLDRRMRHYCGIASRKILRFGAEVDYRDRLFHNLAAILGNCP